MQTIEQLIELYNSGLGYEKIGKVVGRSKRWVGKKLAGHITPRPKKRPIVVHERMVWATTEERNQLILNLYSSGLGAYTIGKKLGIAKGTVSKTLKSQGVELDKTRKSGTLDIADVEEIKKLYKTGESATKLAIKYGVTASAISYHIEEHRTPQVALRCIPPHLQPEIKRLAAEEHWSSYRIAKEYGWAYQSVQKFLRTEGVSVGAFTKEWKESVQRGLKSKQSSLESRLDAILASLGIEYTTQYALGDFRFDFGIINKPNDILVEVQGSYWHTKAQRIQRDIKKRHEAIRAGHKLLVIWDHQLANLDFVKAKILNAIKQPAIDFDRLRISSADYVTCRDLLKLSHYQGPGRAGLTYGLFYNSELIGCIVYNSPMRLEIAKKQNVKNDEILELGRLVIDPKFQARNLASWFIAKTIKELKQTMPQIKLLISFADPTFGHDGTVYKASNWIFDGFTVPSYWYYHRRKNEIFHKKTIWKAAKKINQSEADFARSKQLLKVNGQPKHRYIFRLSAP